MGAAYRVQSTHVIAGRPALNSLLEELPRLLPFDPSNIPQRADCNPLRCI